MSEGHLFILSGPAGAGKGTLRKGLFKAIPSLVFSVSCSTRRARPGEADGVDYHFISIEEFNKLVEQDAFLEWAHVHGNFYGTRRSDVERVLAEDKDIVLEIDVQGCKQVKSKMPQAVRIFITVPSLDELESRLEDRGTETPAELELRLKNASKELMQAFEYEHIIVNDDVERATAELIGVVASYRSPSLGDE